MSWQLRPDARIVIDGQALSAAEAGLVAAKVEVALSEVGSAELVFWPRSRFADAALGGTIAIDLGAADALEPVMTGIIDCIHKTSACLVIKALEASSPLLATHRTKTFLQQTVAAIVEDLASDIAREKVEGDLELAQYCVDGRRSLWAHLRELASLSGSDLRCAPDGKLLFAAAGAGEARSLHRGIDLLAWDKREATAGTAVAALPHGAASDAGQARWHWLRAKTGSPDRPQTTIGALASEEAAEVASAAFAAAATNAGKRGFATIWGRPQIRAGDSVALEGLEGEGGGLLEQAASLLGGGGVGGSELRAFKVTHWLDRHRGFVTRLGVEGGSAPAAGGLAGAIGALL